MQAGLVEQREPVARGDLPLEVPEAGRPVGRRVLGERALDPREGLVEEALRRAVRQALDDGSVPAGVAAADAGAAQQFAVDPLRVHVVVVQTDRTIGDDTVERGGRHLRHRHLREVPAAAADGRKLRPLRGEAGHTVQALLDGAAIAELHLEELAGRVHRVQVRVDEARQDEAAAEVHGPRARTGPLGGLHHAPQRRDPAVLHGQRLVARPPRVHRVHDPVGEHQIRLHETSSSPPCRRTIARTQRHHVRRPIVSLPSPVGHRDTRTPGPHGCRSRGRDETPGGQPQAVPAQLDRSGSIH